MKRILLILLSVAITGSISGCGQKQTPPPVLEPPSTSSSSSTESPAPSTSLSEIPATPLAQRLVVADTMVFRGVISSSEKDGDNTKLTVTKATGSDFPEPEMIFTLDQNTKYGGDKDTLQKDNFVEIFYAKDSTIASAVNSFVNEASVIYNGQIVEVKPDPNDKTKGSILMAGFDNENDYQFNYDENTLMLADITKSMPGDGLHIFHSTISTRSIPPQSSAWEIRPYTK